MVTFFDFLQSWQELEVESLTNKQLDAFKKILESGINEVENEIKKRKNNSGNE